MTEHLLLLLSTAAHQLSPICLRNNQNDFYNHINMILNTSYRFFNMFLYNDQLIKHHGNGINPRGRRNNTILEEEKKTKTEKKRTRRKRKKPRLGFQKTPRDEPKDDRWFPHLDPPNGQWMP